MTYIQAELRKTLSNSRGNSSESGIKIEHASFLDVARIRASMLHSSRVVENFFVFVISLLHFWTWECSVCRKQNNFISSISLLENTHIYLERFDDHSNFLNSRVERVCNKIPDGRALPLASKFHSKMSKYGLCIEILFFPKLDRKVQNPV